MVTFIFGYKLAVLTRMVWSVLALALGAVIGKYKPTQSLKNMAIFLVTSAGCLAWLLIYIIAVAEMDLF